VTAFLELVGSRDAVVMYFTVAFVFGFVPGAVLRLIVRVYPKDDPRRHERIGELYARPRYERPSSSVSSWSSRSGRPSCSPARPAGQHVRVRQG
jgi:hypothetical protein